MATISVTLPSDGQTIDASDVNTPINTIINEINGSLDANNLASGAVTTTKLADASVTDAKWRNGVAFRAYINGAQSMTGSASTKVNFGTEDYDLGDDFSSPDFTAPVDGTYFFSTGCGVGNDRRVFISFFVNGSETARSMDASSARSATLATELELSASDVVDVRFFNGGTTTNNLDFSYITYFTGHLVTRT